MHWMWVLVSEWCGMWYGKKSEVVVMMLSEMMWMGMDWSVRIERGVYV